jgi:hypothetical protein
MWMFTTYTKWWQKFRPGELKYKTKHLMINTCMINFRCSKLGWDGVLLGAPFSILHQTAPTPTIRSLITYLQGFFCEFFLLADLYQLYIFFEKKTKLIFWLENLACNVFCWTTFKNFQCCIKTNSQKLLNSGACNLSPGF